MIAPRTPPLNLQAVPTLTEVIEMPGIGRSVVMQAALPVALDDSVADGAAFVQAPAIVLPPLDEELLVQRVLADLQRNADLMLEYRLRQALAPVMARLSDALVNEVREELVVTLQDVVARAVSQELARQRGR